MIRKVFLLIALLLICAPLTAQAKVALSLQATPARVAAGEWVGLRGEGFTFQERVAFWITAPDGAVLSGDYASANRDGIVIFDFQVPSNALGGRWAITAYGDDSQTPTIATFEVNGRVAEPTTLIAAVNPLSGPPGTTFAFAATGFDKQERISYWFTGPDNKVYDPSSQENSATKEGRIDFTWTAGATLPKGRWVVTIQGVRSGLARGIPFEIR
jgi:hypothetical protein